MSLPPKVTGAPAVIWLVYGELDHDDKHSNFPEVTWCEDAQFDSDVMYVRADLTEIEQLKADNKRLRAALIFVRDKEQAALNEAESLRFNIPEEAGCMEILHAACAALEQKL